MTLLTEYSKLRPFGEKTEDKNFEKKYFDKVEC